MREGRPPALANAPCSRLRSWRIGCTRSTSPPAVISRSPICWLSGACAPDRTGPRRTAKPSAVNRTLADEFLYNYKLRSESERRVRLKRWIHDYNCHRHHTAVGGPPVSRAYNLTRTDI